MRRILLGFCLLGGALSLSSSPALAQVASTVTLSTGGSCVYTGITVSPNGGLLVTCSGGGAAATAPGAPTIGTATALDASINIAFAAPASNGGAAITGYTATCASSDGGVTNTGPGAASPITVSGLTNAKLYTCTVTATNSAGTGAASAASNAVTPTAGAAASPPGAPTGVTVTPGNGTISVAFTAPASNGGAAITLYSATCTSSDGGTTGGPTSGAASPITVPGVTNGKTYTCTVTATNSAGTGTASAASGSTQPVAGCTTPPGTTIGTLKSTGTVLNQTESGTIPAGAVKAFPFVLQAADYPYGAKFETDSGYNAGAYNPKDISVSSCPGVFTGLAYPCMKTGITSNRVTTAPVGNATSLCETIPGQTYYFNVRATDPALNTAAMINPMKR